MAAWRRAIELSLGDEDTAKLRSIAQSRTEPASRVERARILLAYREDPSFYAVARALGLHHQTVQRCVERAVVEGPMAALDDRPRPGREPTITPEAKAWLVSLACRKAKDLGYPHELWTTRLLARHAREHGPAEGHACLADLVQGTVCKILDQDEVKPHKVRYYLEQRDPDFAEKMAEVLCVYREVQILKQAAAAAKKQAETRRWRSSPMMRSRASRRSQPPPPTCRPRPACIRASRGSLNINATARSACWPASISSPARFMPWSRIAIAAANSFGCKTRRNDRDTMSGRLDDLYTRSAACSKGCDGEVGVAIQRADIGHIAGEFDAPL